MSKVGYGSKELLDKYRKELRGASGYSGVSGHSLFTGPVGYSGMSGVPVPVGGLPGNPGPPGINLPDPAEEPTEMEIIIKQMREEISPKVSQPVAIETWGDLVFIPPEIKSPPLPVFDLHGKPHYIHLDGKLMDEYWNPVNPKEEEKPSLLARIKAWLNKKS